MAWWRASHQHPAKTWGPLATITLHEGWPRHGWALLALLLAPLVEEFVFRGVLYSGLAQTWGVAGAGLFVTLVFVAQHLPEVGGYWPALLSIIALGTAAVLLRIRTQSLFPAMLLHASYNLVVVVMVYGGIG